MPTSPTRPPSGRTKTLFSVLAELRNEGVGRSFFANVALDTERDEQGVVHQAWLPCKRGHPGAGRSRDRGVVGPCTLEELDHLPLSTVDPAAAQSLCTTCFSGELLRKVTGVRYNALGEALELRNMGRRITTELEATEPSHEAARLVARANKLVKGVSFVPTSRPFIDQLAAATAQLSTKIARPDARLRTQLTARIAGQIKSNSRVNVLDETMCLVGYLAPDFRYRKKAETANEALDVFVIVRNDPRRLLAVPRFVADYLLSMLDPDALRRSVLTAGIDDDPRLIETAAALWDPDGAELNSLVEVVRVARTVLAGAPGA